MGWPDLQGNDETTADGAVNLTRQIRASWIEWRAIVNASDAATGISAQMVAQRYQELASYRTFMVEQIAANPTGIAAAYLRRRPSLGTFDAPARWAELKPTIDAFITWFKTYWPALTGPSPPAGLPAFQRFKAVTEELEDLPVILTAPQKTAILQRIDAVLAAFLSV